MARESGLSLAEVAAATGMTPRNVRAHQSRGLIPPPTRSGRRAYYGQPHVTRLRAVRELQRRGYNLAAVKALLDSGDTDGAHALRRLALAPMLHDDTAVLDRAELRRRLRMDADSPGAAYPAALELGLLRELPDGRVELPSGRLAERAAELVELGLPADAIFELQRDTVLGCRPLARRFVGLCLQHAWAPYATDGHPQRRWPEVRDTFVRLQEAVNEVVVRTFATQVRQAAEELLAAAEEVPLEDVERPRRAGPRS